MDSANSSRREELRQFLQEELDALKVDPKFRIQWLLEQIENYVDRWGDRRSPCASAGPDDLFTMIEVAAEVMSRELQALHGELNSEWQLFVMALADPNHRDGDSFRVSFQTARTAMINSLS